MYQKYVTYMFKCLIVWQSENPQDIYVNSSKNPRKTDKDSRYTNKPK